MFFSLDQYSWRSKTILLTKLYLFPDYKKNELSIIVDKWVVSVIGEWSPAERGEGVGIGAML
jgi:hypothetical protein